MKISTICKKATMTVEARRQKPRKYFKEFLENFSFDVNLPLLDYWYYVGILPESPSHAIHTIIAVEDLVICTYSLE